MSVLRFERSDAGYGAHLWIGRRIRINSRKSLTPMLPFIETKSGDEFCNDVFVLHLWPLGGVDVWWRRGQRTWQDGRCAMCRSEARAEGICERCMCRPCDCAERDAYYRSQAAA